MQTNNQFTMQRFVLLGKQSFIINKKMIGISLVGFVGILFIALILFQSGAHFRNWDNNSYLGTFLSLFFTLGIIISGHAFSAFRTKEKSMAFLMLPTSASEKFVFELLSRIVLFMVVMPLLFWLVANLEGTVVHYFIPDMKNFKFSYSEAWAQMTHQGKIDGWAKFAMLQGCLFVFIAALTGASHFTKSPLRKTMFTLSVIVAGYALFTFLLVKGLNLEAFHIDNKRVFFIENEHDGMVFLAALTTLINISLLSIAWFRLKEKEA